jgi:hypothetical protein
MNELNELNMVVVGTYRETVLPGRHFVTVGIHGKSITTVKLAIGFM